MLGSFQTDIEGIAKALVRERLFGIFKNKSSAMTAPDRFCERKRAANVIATAYELECENLMFSLRLSSRTTVNSAFVVETSLLLSMDVS